MAAEDGAPAQHLSFLARVAEDARRWGLFPAVRGVEARATHLPRVGRARRPNQSAVDLAQVPALEYPAPTIDTVEFRNARGQLNGFWLGLTGPMGPLPTHLTEFAAYERRYGKQRPFGRWLDVLSNRMLQLFFRAWGDSQPAVQADRPADDRFARYLGALTGATEGVGEAIFPPRARLHYAAVFASRRSAVGIEDALGHLLRQPVRVLQFQPRWRDVEREDQTRLGRGFATLGGDALVGRSVRVASDAFRVVIAARTMHDYEGLLPSGPRFAIAQEALDAFAPSHLEWDIVIEVPEREARPARLDGRTRLGWTGWVSPQASDHIRADARLRRRRAARPLQGGFA
jgi:type VI secretion system ImpH/TssG family protein